MQIISDPLFRWGIDEFKRAMQDKVNFFFLVGI